MTESQKIPLKRVLIEAVAIVASILLAFAIDASWDQAQKRNDVTEHLEVILEDMQSAKEYAESLQKLSLARQESLKQIMQAASPGANKLVDESLNELLNDLGWFAELAIMPEDSIEALIASGNLGIIDSAELRRKLSGWSAFLSMLRDNISPDLHFYFDVWSPYLRKHGDWNLVEKAYKGMPGNSDSEWNVEAIPGVPYPAVSYEEFDNSVLLEQREFRNILTQLWTVQQSVQVALSKLEKELSEVMPLVQAEIAP